jgi:hypothetical protein
MEAAATAPRILTNRHGVAFDLVRANGSVEGVVTLEALEAYFWLEPGASDARTLKCFGDGYRESPRSPHARRSPIHQRTSS